MMRPSLVALLVLLAGCTTPSEDAGAGDDTGADPCSVTITTDPSKKVPTQDGCRCPWMDGCGPPLADGNITFSLPATLTSNHTVYANVANHGTRAITYNANDGACGLEGWTAGGRQIWMPCGIDVVGRTPIKPGESASISWTAAQCLAGRSTGYSYDCTVPAPLAPGVYALRYDFCIEEGEARCKVVVGGGEIEVV